MVRIAKSVTQFVMVAAWLCVPQSKVFSGEELSDEALIKQVKKAIADKIPMSKVEKFVGQKAVLNTATLVGRKSFEILRIWVDDSSSELESLKGIDKVAVWLRPIELHTTSDKCDSPKIIGIARTPKGEIKLFFGEIIPR